MGLCMEFTKALTLGNLEAIRKCPKADLHNHFGQSGDGQSGDRSLIGPQLGIYGGEHLWSNVSMRRRVAIFTIG